MSLSQALNSIGLSKTASQVYYLLLSSGALTAKQIASSLMIPVTGLYRILTRLQEYGFIIEVTDNPKLFQARLLNDALENYFAYQKQQLTPWMTTGRLPSRHPEGTMIVLTGRKEIFQIYATLAQYAQTELLTISIGERVPEQLYRIARDTITRGVSHKLIFQKHTKDNNLWLKRWVAYGCEVRIMPGEGYHLNLIDTSAAILSSSNTSKSAERTAVLITSPIVVIELRKYFLQLWQQAAPLGKIS